MEINLIVETLKFLVLGMSTVFVFLTLMVIVLKIQAKVINKFFPIHEAVIVAKGTVEKKSYKDNLAIVAAIAASVRAYRKSK